MINGREILSLKLLKMSGKNGAKVKYLNFCDTATNIGIRDKTNFPKLAPNGPNGHI